MSEVSGSPALESRYRRLLSLYPKAHRDRYEDEMVTVLMADTPPGHDTPGPRATADLVFGALRARLGAAGELLPDGAWRPAATVAGMLAAFAMLLSGLPSVLHLRLLAEHSWLARQTVVESALTVPWLAVLVTGLLGWRRVAGVTGAVLTVGYAGYLGWWYAFDPAPAAGQAGTLILAVCGTIAVAVGEPGPVVLRRLGAAGTGLVALAWLAVVAARFFESVGFMWLWFLPSGVGALTVLEVLLAAVVPALVLWRRSGIITALRMAAVLAPAVASGLWNATGLAGWQISNERAFHTVIYLTPAQAVSVAAVPVVAFALAVALIAGLDRMRRLVRLGRRAERGAGPG